MTAILEPFTILKGSWYLKNRLSVEKNGTASYKGTQEKGAEREIKGMISLSAYLLIGQTLFLL